MQNTGSMQKSMRCVAATADVCGEGAVWHPAHDSIYWTDINRRLIHRLHLTQSAWKTWTFDQPVTALALTSDANTMLVILGGRVVLWEPSSGREVAVLHRLPSWPAARFNDARVDPAGTLWLGTMQNNVAADGSAIPVTAHVGELISLHASGRTRPWRSGFGITNTVAWSPRGDAFFFGDTLRNTIYRYQYDPSTQSVSDESIFCTGFPRGLPDGSAMDVDGYLWNCRYGGGCIVRFAPDGSVDCVIETPVRNPTTCVFAGNGLQTLYFTSAGEGAQADGPHDGGLFAIDTPFRGMSSTPFPRTTA